VERLSVALPLTKTSPILFVDRVLILGYQQVTIENDSHFQYHDAGELL
jgi:hypothetical protein